MDTVRCTSPFLRGSSNEAPELTRFSLLLSPFCCRFRPALAGIRLAFELDLHLEHKRPLPDDELDALKVLVRLFRLPCLRVSLRCGRLSDLNRLSSLLLLQDRERTWFQLICFDRTLSEQHNRPLMIQPEWVWDLERWATVDHPSLYCLSDTMLASSLSMMKVLDLSKTIRNSEDE